MRKHILHFVIIPVSIVLLLSLALLSPVFEKLEGSIYNAAMGIKKDITEYPDILLVDFGDKAIETAETYPVSRSIYADGLFLLKEMGAKYAVFDIEFIDPSPIGVNINVLNNEVPQYIERQFSSITKNTSDLFSAVANGDIPINDVAAFIPDLEAMTNRTKDDVVERIQSIVRNNDIYLGQAAKVFGKTFFTINVNQDINDITTETYNYFKNNFSIKNITVINEIPQLNFVGAFPTFLNVSRYAAGVGFTNVLIDKDGVSRRIELLRNIDGVYYGQLAFKPLLDLLGNPDMVLDDGKITLFNADIPGVGIQEEMVIPLNPDGSFNINWLPKTFNDSFTHIPFDLLMNHDKIFDLVVKNLTERNDWGYLNAYTGSPPLMEVITYLEQEKIALLNSDEPDISSYISAKEYLLTELSSFLSEETSESMLESLGQLKEAGAIDDVNYEIISSDIPIWFKNTGDSLKQLIEWREYLKERVEGSFAFIGNTATGTTDIGVNPFEEQYMNVGTHANVVNTILNRQYIKLTPHWLMLMISFVLCILLTVIIRNLPPTRSIIIGILSLGLILFFLMLYFRLTSTYIDLLFPSLSIFITFVLLTAMRFLSSEKEKSFINNAFSHYLSKDVIKQILDDPSKLQLGGEMKYMTAMFTDIQSFSTFSEKLTPQDLVRLLNAYLTAMSDTIMDNKGTIDKYEGDAIICFYGAPIYYEDHAYKSCHSAVLMRRVELELNKKFLEDEWTVDMINTRFGINTGDIVVGNMGTEKKMDYTMMGNTVNLASRLEGVNKLYGTWIMVSEETKQQCPDSLFFRRLDRVRVVGIHTPIRLYELVEETSQIDKEVIDAYNKFELALEEFEDKEWAKAKDMFTEVVDILGIDPPSTLYISRCEEYMKIGPPTDWDGVFKMSNK